MNCPFPVVTSSMIGQFRRMRARRCVYLARNRFLFTRRMSRSLVVSVLQCAPISLDVKNRPNPVSERVQDVTYQGSKGEPVQSSFGTFARIRTAFVRNVHWLLSYRGIGDHSKSMAMTLLISSVEGS